MMQHCTIMTC